MSKNIWNGWNIPLLGILDAFVTRELAMFIETPPAEEAHILFVDIQLIGERLKKWDPEIDPAKLKLVSRQPVTWNNGALGCPMPDKCYTQALVPGYLILLEYGNLLIEVHTDRAMRVFAMPGVGFI